MRSWAWAAGWTVIAAGALAAQPVEGTWVLSDRDGRAVAQLEVDRNTSGKLRLTRDGEPGVWVAEDAVLTGSTVYALYRSQGGGAGLSGSLSGQPRQDERFLGVYRLSPDQKALEELVSREDGDQRLLAHTRGQRAVAGETPNARGRPQLAAQALTPPKVDVDALVGRIEQHLRGEDVVRDLKALEQRDVGLRLEARGMGRMGVDDAQALLSGSSRTRLIRQQVDSSAALDLFRLGGLRNPPAQRPGVRALSGLLQEVVVPRRFTRVHLLIGQGRTPSARFSEQDQLETWVLLCETRQGEVMAIKAEWQTPSRASD